MRSIFSCLVLAGLALAVVTPAGAAPLLLISLDGLRAADSANAETMPALAALRREGDWAEHVFGVWPTLTYPSHTTLVTGVPPTQHGIGGNEAFDPLAINREGWMWFARDIRADTLWAAARRAGLKSAAINWPVTVGAPIDDNLPQIWDTKGPEDAGLTRALSTPGLVAKLEHETGVTYPLGSDGSCEADERRARFAEALIADDAPILTAVHLECLDHLQHDFGPDSAEARTARTKLDAMVAKLVASARAHLPHLAVAIVSDHGFAPVHTAINLDAAFRSAGLLGSNARGRPVSWSAAPWSLSGTAGIILMNPGDRAVRTKVEALLGKLQANPATGIDKVLTGADAATTQGDQRIAYWIVFKTGFSAGGYRSGPLIQMSELKGTHGYPPHRAEMAASFIVSNPERPRQGNLGDIPMTSIAGRLAAIIGAKLADANAESAK